MTALVLQSYGRESEYQRAIFTILSFGAWSSEQQVSILLFTDNPHYFAPYIAGLPVDYVLITPEKMLEMKGEMNFIHRVKIAIIEEAFAQLRPSKLLYVDSDTYFQADPAPLLTQLSDKVSAMHEREYAFDQFAAGNAPDNIEARKFIKLLEKGTLVTSRGAERFHGGLYSWNAGTLGLSAEVANFLPDVYALTSEIYQATGWHTSEQNAFGLLLQTRTEVISTSPYIHHYWSVYEKQAMDFILPKKLNSLTTKKLSLSERLTLAREWTEDMPTAVQDYFIQNQTLQLQIQAIQSFTQRQIFQGYRLAFSAFLSAPNDVKFIKDILYHTKRLLFG